MLRYCQYIKENFFDKLEEDSHVEEIVNDIINSAIFNVENGIEMYDFDDFKKAIFDQIHVDTTDTLTLDTDKEIDLCMYAEENLGSKCPETSFDQLSMVISNTAIDAIRIMVEKKLNAFLEHFEMIIDVNDMNSFKFYKSDPFEHYPPNSIDVNKNFTVTKYRKLDGDGDYDVYNYSKSDDIQNIYLVVKL